MVVREDPAAPIEHRRFSDLTEYLRAGDVLVFNDSRVIPARLFARRAGGGQSEILLLHSEPESTAARPVWRALVRPGRKMTAGDRLRVEGADVEAEILRHADDGQRVIAFTGPGDVAEALRRAGHMPLPPYILKRRAAEQAPDTDRAALHEAADRERYQTIYARDYGSVAAPTAGLHFTPELMAALSAKGVECVFVTLHVGAGTFQTMDEGERVEDHAMHREEFEVGSAAADAINRARAAGRRVIAVGTTAVRTLESAASEDGIVQPGRSSTCIMIAPGYRFRAIDALVTNFHLPRSTLLLLVSALLGRDRILHSYGVAVGECYRFFSYGDAMLLIPRRAE